MLYPLSHGLLITRDIGTLNLDIGCRQQKNTDHVITEILFWNLSLSIYRIFN